MQKPGVSYRKRCRKGPKSQNRLKKSEKKRTFYLKTRNKVVFLAELDGLALRDARNRILRSWITIVWPKIDFGIRVSVFRQLNGDFTCKSLTTLCFFAKKVYFLDNLINFQYFMVNLYIFGISVKFWVFWHNLFLKICIL